MAKSDVQMGIFAQDLLLMTLQVLLNNQNKWIMLYWEQARPHQAPLSDCKTRLQSSTLQSLVSLANAK